MITLITGLPGNGKTLYAITWLKDRAEKEGRQVFYSGIKDCMVPGWVEADPEKWMELPKGSIIIIDEVQRLMRPRQHGTKVPEFVAALETHRHLGVDLVLITQHPMLLDSNVRRLVGQHFHVVRKFGKPISTIHEWGACKENSDKNREDSIKHQFIYPKASYALYKSAEVHTSHGRVPMKVWVLLALPFVLGGLIWVAYDRLMNKPKAPIVNAFTGEALAAGTSPSSSGKLTKDQWLAQFAPRVPDLAYTAPVYDEVTKPTVAPYPAACVAMPSKGCGCYSQQGTKLVVGETLCAAIVAGGFFIAWDQKLAPAVALPVPVAARGADAVSMSGPTGFASSPRIDARPAVSVLQDGVSDLPPGRGKALPPLPKPS